MNDLHTPQISLFSEHEEPQSYEVYVYGTDDLNEQNKDSFCVALCRYLDEINISQKTLANDFVSRYNIVMRSIAQTTAFDIRRII